METTAAFRSAMVSRLPKFGGRSSNGGTNPLPNGSTQPTPQDGRTSHPNGVIRAPSFSFKWKKDEAVAPPSPAITRASEDRPKIPMAAPNVEVKKASPGTPKMRRSSPMMVAVSSPKAIPKHAAKTISKIESKISHPNGSAKVNHSESSPEVAKSLPMKQKLRSISPRSGSHDSLSQSSDSLKTLAVDNMVRSNSFTHFKQIPSPSSQPMTRSFSFNRAVELAKPLANTQLRPPRTNLLKPPQLSNGRVGLGMGSLNGGLSGSGGLGMSLGGLHYSRMSPTASSLPAISTPSAPNTPSSLKKPLVESCALNKSGNSNNVPAGHKLPRSAPVKQHPLLPGRLKEKVQPLAPERQGLIVLASDTESADKAEKAGFHSDSDGSAGDKNAVCRKSPGRTCGEALEDMSLSSASSLDRGDTSEEFLDDFDSSGDVLSDVDAAEDSKTTQSRMQRLLHDTVDWPHQRTEEPTEISPMDVSCGSLVLSTESSHAPAGSSLELSPSNSSSGTYMWDEDGLEPLGGPASHPCDSFDFSSIDILNTLEPLGAAELEEDDLMLDVDLPEDSLHESDQLSLMERSDRGRQGPRRRQHWSGPDHFHNSRVHGFQHYDGFRAHRFPSRPFYSEGKQHGHIPMPDELTLQHMSQDCSALKNHLLRLKNLLQFEDADSAARATEEETDDNGPVLQLEELLKEVQVLREELRSRDTTIVQLTLQCQQLQQQHQQMPAQGHQVRCQCHHQRAPHTLRTSDGQRKQQHYDKATQTHWRPPTHSGVLPTPMLPPWQTQQQGLARTSMPQRRHMETLVHFFTDKACLKYYSLSAPTSKSSSSTRED